MKQPAGTIWNRYLPWFVLGLPILWLVWSACTVTVELYDGYDAIVNTRHFLGLYPHYVSNRAPLVSWLLLPVARTGDWLGLHPLDPRPFHAVMALVHGAYLVLIWVIICRESGSGLKSVTVAFIGSVLTFVFFSYAPFISHDIFPGGLFLLMLVLYERFSRCRSRACWAGLVVLGTASVLVKQTFGVFWFAILMAEGVRILRDRRRFLLDGGSFQDRCERLAGFLWLGVGALCSAVIYWLVMGVILRGNYPDAAFLIRPWKQICFVLGQYGGQGVVMPWWVYLRNAPFYGLTTTVLIIPGLTGALCGRHSFRRNVAVAWIATFAVMQILGSREVRYLAFLMPLSAVLVAHAAEQFLPVRRYFLAILCLLAVDVGISGREAARLRDGFYRHNPVFTWLPRAGSRAGETMPEIGVTRTMTFMPPLASPLAGDRYHRLFHLSWHHLAALCFSGTEEPPVFSLPDAGSVLAFGMGFPGRLLFDASSSLVNAVSLVPRLPPGLAAYRMIAAVSSPITTGPSTGQFRFEKDVSGGSTLIFTGPELVGSADSYIFVGLADVANGRAYAVSALVPIAPTAWRIVLAGPVPSELSVGNLQLWGFRVKAAAAGRAGRAGLEYRWIPDS